MCSYSTTITLIIDAHAPMHYMYYAVKGTRVMQEIVLNNFHCQAKVRPSLISVNVITAAPVWLHKS